MEEAEGAAAAAPADLGSDSGPFWPQPESDEAIVITKAHTAHDDIRRAATLFLHCNIRAILAIMPSATLPTTLTDAEYFALTRALLDGVEAQIDRWLQEDKIDIDAQRTGSLLELSFPNGTKMVLNAQPPLREMWLAARSGGFHYRHVGGRWLDTRDGGEFFASLSSCATEQAGLTLQFAPPA